MTLENADYFVRLVDMPTTVGGFVSPNEDGTYNVFLNSRRSVEQNIETYFHEWEHIEDDDFYNDLPIEEVEHLRC